MWSVAIFAQAIFATWFRLSHADVRSPLGSCVDQGQRLDQAANDVQKTSSTSASAGWAELEGKLYFMKGGKYQPLQFADITQDTFGILELTCWSWDVVSNTHPYTHNHTQSLESSLLRIEDANKKKITHQIIKWIINKKYGLAGVEGIPYNSLRKLRSSSSHQRVRVGAEFSWVCGCLPTPGLLRGSNI